MDTLEVYEAKDGWRWRRQAGNGEVISESGEAYTREYDAKDAAVRANPDPRDYEIQTSDK